jgi:hypothetical protein
MRILKFVYLYFLLPSLTFHWLSIHFVAARASTHLVIHENPFCSCQGFHTFGSKRSDPTIPLNLITITINYGGISIKPSLEKSKILGLVLEEI